MTWNQPADRQNPEQVNKKKKKKTNLTAVAVRFRTIKRKESMHNRLPENC